MTDNTNTHTEAFHEAWQSSHVDPLAQLEASDFPFDEIFRRLDGEDGNGDERIEALTEAFKVLLFWMAKPYKNDASTSDFKLRRTGERVLAALWVLDPAFTGKGLLSASALSLQIGNNRVTISDHASEFTRRFGIRNRFQSQGRNGKHAAKLMSAIENQKPELQ